MGNKVKGGLEIVFWDLEDRGYTREELVRALEKAGLSPGLVPVAPSSRKALTRALNEARKLEERRLIRRIVETAETVAYGVVREEVDVENIDLNYHKTGVILFNKKTGEIRFEGERVDEVRQFFDRYLHIFTKEDVHQLLKTVLTGVSHSQVKPGSGVYYVWGDEEGLVKRMEGFVSELGGVFGRIPIPDVEELKFTFLRLWEQEFEERGRRHLEQVRKALESGDGALLGRALEGIHKLMTDCELLLRIVEKDSQSIRKTLDDINAELREALGIVESPKSPFKTSKA